MTGKKSAEVRVPIANQTGPPHRGTRTASSQVGDTPRAASALSLLTDLSEVRLNRRTMLSFIRARFHVGVLARAESGRISLHSVAPHSIRATSASDRACVWNHLETGVDRTESGRIGWTVSRAAPIEHGRAYRFA